MRSPLSGLPAWQQALLALAAAKVAAGLLAVTTAMVADPALVTSRLPVFGVYLVLFTGGAMLLLFGARGNRAAIFLGSVFLLAAVPWADTPIEGSAIVGGGTGSVWLFLPFVRVDAFLPFFLWSFSGVFPNSDLFGQTRRVHRWGMSLALAAGAFLFLTNLLMLFGRVAPGLGEDGVFGWARETTVGAYWTVLYLLDIAALAFLVVRSRRTRLTDRRRVRLFIAALALGAAPMLLITIGELFIPLIARLWASPRGSLSLLLVIDAGLLSIPVTTAYAVLVHRVVDLRFVLRKAMQYALARYTVLAATLVPFLLLVGLLYRNRQQTLASILSGRAALAMLGLIALGGLAFRLRRRLLRALDRRFFREQYDSARILTDLAQRLRLCETTVALWDSLREEIILSLHPVTLDLLVRGHDTAELVSVGGAAVSLPIKGPLLTLLPQYQVPFECALERLDSASTELSERELDWLTDGEYQLLAPILGADRSLLGVVALGPKVSELPYSKEDRQLLIGISTAAALVVETRLSGVSGPTLSVDSAEPTRTFPGGGRPELGESAGARRSGVSAACSACGRIYEATVPACLSCGGDLESLSLPRSIHGKFRLERLIGRGGMGVVFLARDLDLGRDVAIKSLPRMSARYSSFLRREARAMAAVTHPHLALIFGAESYHRLPLLVFEYLPGGTLASRIAQGPMPVGEVLDIGARIADVTDCIHRAGILHRDIKPSNIGFTSEASPKLLDFGLARLVQAGGLGSGGSATDSKLLSSSPRRVAGTLMYLSPEAIRGRDPDYSVDLWGLSVTLYEALTGANPFRGETASETLDKIERAVVPDLGDSRPDCSAEVSSLFRRALARDRRRRPASARDLRAELKSLAARAA